MIKVVVLRLFNRVVTLVKFLSSVKIDELLKVYFCHTRDLLGEGEDMIFSSCLLFVSRVRLMVCLWPDGRVHICGVPLDCGIPHLDRH